MFLHLKMTRFDYLSIKWNSIRLGGPDNGIETKKLYMKLFKGDVGYLTQC